MVARRTARDGREHVGCDGIGGLPLPPIDERPLQAPPDLFE